MNERERALQALAGRTFPRFGDTGVYKEAVGWRAHADVSVTRMSADGIHLTVRVLGRQAVRQYGAFLLLQRESDVGNGYYVVRRPGPNHWVAGGWVQF